MNGNVVTNYAELKVTVPDQTTNDSLIQKTNKSKSLNFEDLLKIIHAQQTTINKLTKEIKKNTQSISKEEYEKILNELETEKYHHAKTKLELIQSKDVINSKIQEIELFKNELEKERCAYASVYQFLKNKLINESSKGIDLISKIAEAEIKYNDVIEGLNQKESRYSQIENDYEHRIEELNLKAEQEKYISSLIQDKPNRNGKTKKKV
ncbi:spermatogenesis-associated 24 isoform X1 [Brachionus plicatilis]|nr:spermatogenesis-associated 24 isoform X1 [Brachionus plicatilis]